MFRFALVASSLVIAASAVIAQTRIPVCNEYLAKWDDCVKRLPEFLQNDASIRDGKMRKFIVNKVKREKPAATQDTERTEQFCQRQMEFARKGELFHHYGCKF
jgi:hypothetical protein